MKSLWQPKPSVVVIRKNSIFELLFEQYQRYGIVKEIARLIRLGRRDHSHGTRIQAMKVAGHSDQVGKGR